MKPKLNESILFWNRVDIGVYKLNRVLKIGSTRQWAAAVVVVVRSAPMHSSAHSQARSHKSFSGGLLFVVSCPPTHPPFLSAFLKNTTTRRDNQRHTHTLSTHGKSRKLWKPCVSRRRPNFIPPAAAAATGRRTNVNTLHSFTPPALAAAVNFSSRLVWGHTSLIQPIFTASVFSIRIRVSLSLHFEKKKEIDGINKTMKIAFCSCYVINSLIPSHGSSPSVSQLRLRKEHAHTCPYALNKRSHMEEGHPVFTPLLPDCRGS